MFNAATTKQSDLIALRNILLFSFSFNYDKCFRADDLLLHQLSYSVFTLNALDANKLKLLNAYYEEAKQNALLSESFSLIDPKEYFASAVSPVSSIF
jgi:hypothetical protein